MLNRAWTHDVREAVLFASLRLLQRDNMKVSDLTWSQHDLVEGHELQLTNTVTGARTYAYIALHEMKLFIVEATVPKGAPPATLFQTSMGWVTKPERASAIRRCTSARRTACVVRGAIDGRLRAGDRSRTLAERSAFSDRRSRLPDPGRDSPSSTMLHVSPDGEASPGRTRRNGPLQSSNTNSASSRMASRHEGRHSGHGAGARIVSTSIRPGPVLRMPCGTPPGATTSSPDLIGSSRPSSRTTPSPSST